jgi:hypothetical protein
MRSLLKNRGVNALSPNSTYLAGFGIIHHL